MPTTEKITLLKATEAAEYLRVSMYTLNKMREKGVLIPFRTVGGHRRYSLEQLNEWLDTSKNLAFGSQPAKAAC